MVVPGNCGNLKTQNNKYNLLISLYIIFKKNNRLCTFIKTDLWFIFMLSIYTLIFTICSKIVISH